ncbi:winged helix-turn-helix transcriptional regulator [Vallitalea pronyensis]|uniref:Winged helix-turn-helix transcriptional regulator n=1 Tax=Vallitalea pronyensis TaxID=1348613 RepID=A0A8J8MPK5_9FIRM|nr:winged helix-turn-helix domain-containing protein [Vallitalea pronyensis]QUI25028.1 winged helix-turn-helix transcriptional regulator [Vallitalea pronyensis]
MDVSIQYNEIVDLHFAIKRYIREDEYNKHDLVNRFELTKDIQGYIQHVKDHINPILHRDIEYLCGNMVRGLFSVVYDALEQGIQDVPSFFNYLRALDVEGFLALIYQALDIEGIENMDREQQRIAIEDHFKDDQTDGDDPGLYMDYIKYPQEVKERLTNTLESFYTLFLLPRRDKVNEIIQKKLKEHQQLLEEDPNTFFENMILLVDKEVIQGKTVHLYLSYYGELTCSLKIEKDALSILYGFLLEQRYNKNMKREDYKDLLKTLSDDKRYDIIELLGKRAWYSKELADHMGITTATMSYHLKKISTLGIISVEAGPHKRLYYRLNKEKFKKLMANMTSDIVDE